MAAGWQWYTYSRATELATYIKNEVKHDLSFESVLKKKTFSKNTYTCQYSFKHFLTPMLYVATHMLITHVLSPHPCKDIKYILYIGRQINKFSFTKNETFLGEIAWEISLGALSLQLPLVNYIIILIYVT